MSDLIMPFEGKDLESSSTTTNNKTKDAIEWELNEDKRAAREKSLWYVLSYEYNAYPKIDRGSVSAVYHYYLQSLKVLESVMRHIPPYSSHFCAWIGT